MVEHSAHTTLVLSGPALHEAKRALRVRMIAARDVIEPAARAEASDAIVAMLGALPSFVASRCVLLTLPFNSEWDTRPLLAAALDAGKVVALPRVNRTTRMLELHRIEDIDGDTTAGYRGIPEPRAALARIELEAVEWILVPGVAFDAQGRRLGYGGGFYDRLLPLLNPATPRVAGAFDVQVIARVPAAPHDVRIQHLVTPTRTFVGAPG